MSGGEEEQRKWKEGRKGEARQVDRDPGWHAGKGRERGNGALRERQSGGEDAHRKYTSTYEGRDGTGGRETSLGRA